MQNGRCKRIVRLFVITILFPLGRVGIDVVPDPLIVPLVADDVIVEIRRIYPHGKNYEFIQIILRNRKRLLSECHDMIVLSTSERMDYE